MSVLLVLLDRDPVGCEVLHGDEDALCSVDDEVPARVEWVLACLLEELPVRLRILVGGCRGEGPLIGVVRMQVASRGSDHDREVPDVDALLLVRDGLVVPHDLEVEVYGGEVGELPYSGLHRSCRVLCAVGLPDGRLSEPDVLQPDDDLLVQDVELDHAALVVLDGLVLADPD